MSVHQYIPTTRSFPQPKRYRSELDVGGCSAGGCSSARRPRSRLSHLRRGAGLRRAQPYWERFFKRKVQIQGVYLHTSTHSILFECCWRAGARAGRYEVDLFPGFKVRHHRPAPRRHSDMSIFSCDFTPSLRCRVRPERKRAALRRQLTQFHHYVRYNFCLEPSSEPVQAKPQAAGRITRSHLRHVWTNAMYAAERVDGNYTQTRHVTNANENRRDAGGIAAQHP